MAKALKCDKCGGFYDLITDYRRYKIIDGECLDTKKFIDLCPDCYNRFLAFLKVHNSKVIMGDKEESDGSSDT